MISLFSRANKISFLSFFIALGLFYSGSIPASAQEQEEVYIPEKIINTMEVVFGLHKGQRRNHSKGVCAAGTFTASPLAAAYTRSPIFSGQEAVVLARFSLPGGKPEISDTAKTPRGMALYFSLPDGEEHAMAMLNVPVFGASSPETFLHALEAKIPDPVTGKVNPSKIKSFKETHPDTKPLADYLSVHNPPESYATTAYHSLHAFVLSNDKDDVTNVKWRFVPKLGEIELTDAQLEMKANDFLKADLVKKTEDGPVLWDMIVSIGEDGDSLKDPTKAWPEDRQKVLFGTLSLNKVYDQSGPCEEINYDPLLLTDGFDATDDPVLQARSPSYAISVSRRLEEQSE